MRRGLLPVIAIAIAMIFPGTVAAQIYRTTDADGNVVFTDTPPPGGSAEQVNLQRTNTAEPPPPPPQAEPEAAEDEPAVEQAPVQTVVITSPRNDETIPQGAAGSFSVVARVEPELEKGQSLRLSLDGQPTGKLMQSGFWDLELVDRGTHNLVVAIVGSNGRVVSESRPVTVHVMRTIAPAPAPAPR